MFIIAINNLFQQTRLIFCQLNLSIHKTFRPALNLAKKIGWKKIGCGIPCHSFCTHFIIRTVLISKLLYL